MLAFIIGVGLILVALALVAFFVSRNIVTVPPDRALVLSGRRMLVVDPSTGQHHTKGHRVISGGSAFRVPMLERADYLPLGEMSILLDADDLRDIEGRARSVSLHVNCRISTDEPHIERAISRFLTMDLPDIENVVRTTVESRLINTLLTLELSDAAEWPDIERDLDTAIRDDLAGLGVQVDTLIFRSTPTGDPPIVTVNGQERDRAG